MVQRKTCYTRCTSHPYPDVSEVWPHNPYKMHSLFNPMSIFSCMYCLPSNILSPRNTKRGKNIKKKQPCLHRVYILSGPRGRRGNDRRKPQSSHVKPERKTKACWRRGRHFRHPQSPCTLTQIPVPWSGQPDTTTLWTHLHCHVRSQRLLIQCVCYFCSTIM